MSCYQAATGPGSGPTPGALVMVEAWRRITGLGSLGIFNPRPIRGTGAGTGRPLRWSLHAEGRAGDLRCNALDPAERILGDRFAAEAIEHFAELGVQQIIWNRRIWSCTRAAEGWRPYNGSAGPHLDHLHTELNRAGAARPAPLWATLTLGDETDMTPAESKLLAEVAQKLDVLYSAFIEGAPAVGAPPLGQSITQTAYAAAGVDLPKRPSIRAQVAKLIAGGR